MLEADAGAVATKAAALSSLFIEQVEADCAGHGLRLASPRSFADRGSHVSFAHAEAYSICRALIDRGVIGDFRAPDVIRFGFTPLYTSFVDVWRASRILAGVMAARDWDRDAYRNRARVT